jgi:drug/metabolite transporter (DMT)-like permease
MTTKSDKRENRHVKGINAALLSALFLGLAPIFGKQAILNGFSPLSVVAIRTGLAAALMLIVMLIFARKYLYIYPAGLLGCMIAGWINGLGSLFYYSSLGRIDASLGQLLYSLYPLFLILWLSLDKQLPSRLTVLRLAIAIPAIYLITHGVNSTVDIIGMIQMLIASALYALHIPINQRVLYDMPAPTVTVYTLIAMSAMVIPTYIFSASINQNNLLLEISLLATNTRAVLNELFLLSLPLLGLTLVTFLSRITLFLGVKHLGGLQTALLGLGELLVTVTFSYVFLGERMSIYQWIGAFMLALSILLIGFDKRPQTKSSGRGLLNWLNPPEFNSSSWQPPK